MTNRSVRSAQIPETRHPPLRTVGALRILLLIDNLHMGGAQRLIEMQAKALLDRLHAVRIVNLGGPSAISKTLQVADVDVVDIGVGPLRNYHGLSQVANAVRLWQPDIIHAHLLHSTLLGAALAPLCGARLVVTLHSVLPDRGGLSLKFKIWIERLILRYIADRVISCGPGVASARGPLSSINRTDVISNCVRVPEQLSSDERKAVRKEFGFSPDNFVIIAVGRLAKEKGFDILLEAFMRASDSMPSARLLIVGEGEDRLNLAKRIDCSGQGDRIVLAGLRNDVNRLLGAADMFVLSSRWEGLPLVVLEAMAAGLPIIATDVGDVAWATGCDGAVLVPSEDVVALAGEIMDIAGDFERRSALALGALRAATPFVDLSSHIEKLLQLYNDVSLEH